MKKVIIGLYSHDPRGAAGEGSSQLVKRIELPEQLDILTRRKKWKQEISSMVAAEGYEVLAISIVHSGAALDVNIIVTIGTKPPRFGEKKRAVTKGGSRIEGPIKTKKTMAAKQRSAQEAPRR